VPDCFTQRWDKNGDKHEDVCKKNMARFLTELDISVKADNLFKLEKPLVYESSVLKATIRVPEGFYTDLASVPRVPVIYTLWGNRAHHEAVLHDYLYRIDAEPAATYEQANRVFLEAMRERGKGWWISRPMYWGVCIGGNGSYHKRKVGWIPGL
jgi:hypothetical protein